jgi:O-antigen/teichoic acid export membrane protein
MTAPPRPATAVAMGRRDAGRSILRNASHLIAAQWLAYGLRAVYLVTLARLLGPELFSLISYAQFWQLLFFAVVVFGTGRLLSREIGRDPDGFAETLANSLTLRLLLALLVAPVAALAGWWLAPEPAAQQLLVAFSLALAARGIASWVQQVCVAFGASRLILRQEGLWRAVEVVLGLGLLAMGAGLAGIAAAHALSWCMQAAAGLALVHRRLHPLALGWHLPRVRRLLHDGLSAMLTAAAVSLIMSGSLVVYLTLFPGRSDGGQLAVVLQALTPLLLLPQALAVSTLPVLGRQVAAGTLEADHTMRKLLRFAVLGSSAIALIGSAAGPGVVKLLLGSDYAMAGSWLGPALWLLPPFGAGQLLAQLLYARGDVWPNAAGACAGALVTVLTLWPLAQILGGAGVLLAMGVGLLTWVLLLTRLAFDQGGSVSRARLAPGVDADPRPRSRVPVPGGKSPRPASRRPGPPARALPDRGIGVHPVRTPGGISRKPRPTAALCAAGAALGDGSWRPAAKP